MIEHVRAGDLAATREKQFRSVRLVHLLASYGFLAACKATFDILGDEVGPPRLPQMRLTPKQVVNKLSRCTRTCSDWATTLGMASDTIQMFCLRASRC